MGQLGEYRDPILIRVWLCILIGCKIIPRDGYVAHVYLMQDRHFGLKLQREPCVKNDISC